MSSRPATPHLTPVPSLKPLMASDLSNEEEDEEEPAMGALANMVAEVHERKMAALASNSGGDGPSLFKKGPVRDRHGMIMTFDQVTQRALRRPLMAVLP